MARKLIYSMQMSLDGYIEDANGGLDWANVDEELHRHFNDEERANDTILYGRRLYELMAEFWPTADQDPATPDYVVEYSRIWKSKPKVVFSKTLDHVEWNSRLVRDDAGAEVAKLKEEPGGQLSVGGATLAGSLIQAGLVDEFRVYIHPMLLGSGKPFFPTLNESQALRLVETRTFGNGVVLLRYECAD
jgi:dihydrofolate reductase